MFALNFISPHNETLLVNRTKTATIRLGDIRDTYPENSIVWVTVGGKYGPKKKLYQAIIDKAVAKSFSELTEAELTHQDPTIKTVDELIAIFEKIYDKKIYDEDIITVVHFSEIYG